VQLLINTQLKRKRKLRSI